MHILLPPYPKRGTSVNIAVLAGGLSPERDVSLVSGGLIARALAGRGHKILLLDLYEGVDTAADPRTLFSSDVSAAGRIAESIPDLDALRARHAGRRAEIGPGVLEVCAAADVVFLALHGGMGEDGHIQATLDSFGIRYTGSGATGSLLAMDKDLSKRMLARAGVPTAPWVYYDASSDSPRRVLDEIGLPCVVKPGGCGSSVGVSMVSGAEELDTAISEAVRYQPTLVIERRIYGREFSVGVLGDTVLPPIEIIPRHGFYDYKNKYQSNMTREVCPAGLTEAQLARVSDYTRRAFRCLRLSGYARGDFIMDETGEFWCLEFNTLPGMTPISLLPQEAAAVGISYGELCERIVDLALQ